MGKKRDNLNAWEMSIIASALAEYAAKIGGSDSTMALSKVFENAKSVTVTHQSSLD